MAKTFEDIVKAVIYKKMYRKFWKQSAYKDQCNPKFFKLKTQQEHCEEIFKVVSNSATEISQYWSGITPAKNLKGSLITCYIGFCTSNFSCFLPYPFPTLHIMNWCVLAASQSHLPWIKHTHTHKHKPFPSYRILHLHIHIKILSVITEKIGYTETRDCMLTHDLLRNLHLCNI
jgi:hypothetical protein